MKTPKEQQQPAGDRSLRFVFDGTDIRGETVNLEASYREILAIHQYPPGVSRLIGEFLAAAVLLSTTVKYRGKLILQASSTGQIPLLMVECSSERQIRAIARGAQQATSENFAQLLGDGHLAITVDPEGGQRYQGIVPLAGNSLAASLQAYFAQSEQLQTRLWLASDGQSAGGLLLQQLPAQVTTDPDQRQIQWQHACALSETLAEDELLGLRAEEILHRLYHADPLRVFEPAGVAFRCSCSRARTFGALAALDGAELQDILEERGCITMDCEFCNQQYVFTPEDIKPLLRDDGVKTLH